VTSPSYQCRLACNVAKFWSVGIELAHALLQVKKIEGSKRLLDRAFQGCVRGRDIQKAGTMNGISTESSRRLSVIGCLSMAMAVFFLCLMPVFLFDTMQAALGRLHLSPTVALLSVLGIFLGSLVNIPLYRIRREESQLIEPLAILGVWGWMPQFRRVRRDTLIAINVGGGVIPLTIAVWQIAYLIGIGGGGLPLLALIAAVAGNILACYLAAFPVEGVGIFLPGIVSPGVSLGLTWLLLWPTEYSSIRASVAFAAGVLGPSIGADLLHLRGFSRVSAGMLSIGGAGTFDGIVLSGVLAALLA
jgi:uncharacterized membrane protein